MLSTPSHPRYGQFLKQDELKEMLRPKSEATTSVMKWLVDSGVNPESIAEEGEWINFVTPVEVANDILDTTFGIYQDSRGQKRIRTLKYSILINFTSRLYTPVPRIVPTCSSFTDMFQPTIRFGEIQPHSSQVYAIGEFLGTIRLKTYDETRRNGHGLCPNKLQSITENPSATILLSLQTLQTQQTLMPSVSART